MHQWYFSYSGQQVGPLDQASATAQAKSNPSGHCWRAGFAEWLPIAAVGELNQHAPSPMMAPPAPVGGQSADQIDYKIFGEDTQFVEIELDPGESAVAEAGAMMYKNSFVSMETVFGDGNRAAEQKSGFFDKLVGAGKRLITGESLFTTVYTHKGGSGKALVAFAAPYPGTIIAMSLKSMGGRIICQKDAFLCAARGVQIGIFFQRKIMTALFGGEGFIMQKLEGDGMVFIHAGGTITEKDLQAGEVLHIDTGCVVAFTDGMGFDVEQVGGIKSMVFGGEGVFFAKLTGPGRVWIQSLPLSRLAGRILAAAPQMGGAKDEGSVLGGLGNILSGDRGF